MNTIQRIAKNTGVLIIAQIVGHLLAFFYGAYTARYLGAESFGILSFGLAFTGIFGVFTNLGLGSLTVREVARDKSLASKYLGNIVVIKFILAIVVFGLIVLTINLLGYPEQTMKVVYLLALSIICKGFGGVFGSIFNAYEKMEYNSIGQILNSSLMLGGVLFAINQRFNVVGFAFLYFIVSAISLIYSFVICVLKFAKPKIEVDWLFWKRTIKEALPFGLALAFVTTFYWISSVMLSLMKGDVVVGWYNAAYRIVLFLLFIPNTFISSLYPVMARFYIKSEDSLRYSFEKSLQYLTLLALPLGVGTTLLAPRLIFRIFGPEYTNSIGALQILIWSTVFIFMSQPFGNLFNCLNKQSIVTKITAICLGLNVIINLMLIPKYGLIGASIATVFTEFTSLTLSFIWSLRIGYGILKKEFADFLIKVLISSALMGIFVLFFQNLTLWILVPFAALFYFIILYVIRGITKEDIYLFRRIIVEK